MKSYVAVASKAVKQQNAINVDTMNSLPVVLNWSPPPSLSLSLSLSFSLSHSLSDRLDR